MDPLGNVVREFLKKAHSDNVRNAMSLAVELQDDENMTKEQVEEMLFSSGFEADVVAEVIDNMPAKRNKKAK